MEERARRFSVGIALYPLVVLLLIFTFQRNLQIAAAGWGYLAFGDGFASIVGMSVGGARLPWNPKKSVSGSLGYVVFGFLGAAFLYGFVAARVPSGWELGCLVAAALAGAAVESLPSELDDNVLPPLVAAAVLALLLPCRAGALDALDPAGAPRSRGGGRGQRRGGRDRRGARGSSGPPAPLAGALLGTLVLGFGGAGLYVLLWVFFLGGTLATRFRRARKEAIGKAEEKGGRRGVSNVLANVSVAAFCALVAGLGAARRRAAARGRRRARDGAHGHRRHRGRPGDRRRRPSSSRTSAACRRARTGPCRSRELSPASRPPASSRGSGSRVSSSRPPGRRRSSLAAFLGTVVESLLGRAGAPWRVSNGHVLNFVNTLAGAAVAPPLAALLGGLA